MKKPSKISHFQYGHFVMPIYKSPLPTILTLFVPTWLLGIINLGIFFQDVDQENDSSGKRLLNIGALMIAYTALIPTIRSSIPPASQIIFIEIIMYLQSLTTLFSLIETIKVRL